MGWGEGRIPKDLASGGKGPQVSWEDSGIGMVKSQCGLQLSLIYSSSPWHNSGEPDPEAGTVGEWEGLH